MRKNSIVVLVLLLSVSLFGQTEPTSPKAAMEKLAFLAGQWAGTGWQIGQDRQKRTFTQTEDITIEAAGEVLLIKGIGKSIDEETKEEMVVHNALAMISYNPKEKNYDFSTYAIGQGAAMHKGNLVGENHFEWFIETPRGKIRFTITLNEQGQWFEKGEFAMGESWFQFFEMTLDKQLD